MLLFCNAAFPVHSQLHYEQQGRWPRLYKFSLTCNRTLLSFEIRASSNKKGSQNHWEASKQPGKEEQIVLLHLLVTNVEKEES